MPIETFMAPARAFWVALEDGRELDYFVHWKTGGLHR